MDKVRIEKKKLLDVIKTNRQQHREIFEEALIGFRREVIKRLEEALSEARAGNRYRLRIELTQPMDQTKEYDSAIKLLELSVDDIIELDSRQFQNLVMDNWSWSDQFITSNSAYSIKAREFNK